MLKLKGKVLGITLSILIASTQLLVPTTSSASNTCPNTNAFSGITDLTLWLRADCVTGNAADPADNSTVSTWIDLSGNGFNATASGSPTYQSDAANLINSQPVVNFNGSSVFTSIDIRANSRPNISIFAVYKSKGSGNREGVWGVDNGGWDRFFLARWSNNDGLISAGNSANVTNSGIIGTATLITTVYRYQVSSGTKVYRNGELSVSITDQADPSNAYTNLLIGSGGSGLNFTGDIAEIIIFNQALSESDIKTVNGYLNTKYNLGISASNIPVNLTFDSLTIGANVSYRQVVTITANVSTAAKVTFKARNVVIPGCKNKLTSATSPFIATCTWRPSIRGSAVLTASAVPTTAGGTLVNAAPITLAISNRSGAR
jgi:hypothetical protein